MSLVAGLAARAACVRGRFSRSRNAHLEESRVEAWRLPLWWGEFTPFKKRSCLSRTLTFSDPHRVDREDASRGSANKQSMG